ncbi:MAG: sigma-70 family RNA polymerase sigma factor [Luteitalea sp.]|nr:sigma-70 family RNA polymerase sigma factor [Luteitalea sp.]
MPRGESELSDEALVERVTNAPEGDTGAFETLVQRHQRGVLANCRHLTTADAAEDLAQEVFVKAYFALDRFEGRSSFKTWVQRIKVNHCLNYLRRRRGVAYVDLEDETAARAPELQAEADAERALEVEDARRHIAALLDAMSDTLRIPLVMRDADGMSYEEIASVLGIGLSAVKMRIKRGREEFRRLFVLADGSVGVSLDQAARGADHV